ncbi:MAG: NAD(P)-dependent alcohol dehydrogenase, partial [Gemmatimonadetes bacterium]|nr:NAD(P)-dependent alcohol dehydrogenase [Gemmatimonadota bacterium]
MTGRRSWWRLIRRVLSLGVVLLLLAAVTAYVRSTNECPPATPVGLRTPMQAWIHCEFGGPEVLRRVELERPTPSDSQLLVRVVAASVNPADWHGMRGSPLIARIAMGWRVPTEVGFGTDFAGVVEAVGPAATRFQPGDSVFGARTGALAEYVLVRHDRVARKPATMTLDEAAAIPVAAITALQGVRDQGEVGAGHRVLVNGASGGVGTFAVQIAKSLGATVTGVSSTRNVELVRSIGADRTIDYTATNFTLDSARYDVIIDNVGNHSLGDLARVLTPTGRYVMIGGPSGAILDPLPRVVATVLR